MGQLLLLILKSHSILLYRNETTTDSRIVSLLQHVHRTDSILVYNRDRVNEIKPQQTTNNQYLETFRHESVEVLKEIVSND